ncbi:MAG: hypothetical protein IJU37_02570 [Desulfovibrio sp.]|nr:hypothetical protein [Desulfovibrio sp.]
MKLLLGCVNSAVSLVGYDWDSKTTFWYCPGNYLRVCGLQATSERLWIASDNTLTSLGGKERQVICLPGPHENLAHSVKKLGQDALGVADTGNSRVLLYADGRCVLEYRPLDGWECPLPPDAIHLNDILSWDDGILASAFSYQPFTFLKQGRPQWKQDGLGVIFYLRRHGKRTVSSIAASGLNCAHSLTQHGQDVYCCSSAEGSLYRFTPAGEGRLAQSQVWHVTDDHFLRGCLRVPGGWMLGGSSRRHVQGDARSGMLVYFLADSGAVEQGFVAPVGEIYDILPWDDDLMRNVAQQILAMPQLPLEGDFPPLCAVTF